MFIGEQRGIGCAATPTRSLSSGPGTRILAVQGGDSDTIQALLARLAERWVADGSRVTGVVEEEGGGPRKGCGGTRLRNLGTGATYDIYQDLGPQSTACCLDARGFAEACQHIVDEIPASDIVVLSKFGKLESERGGLLAAFAAAALHDKPVITAVSPTFNASYLAFVGPYGAIVSPDETELHAWGCARLS
jgi:hypothetical protein